MPLTAAEQILLALAQRIPGDPCELCQKTGDTAPHEGGCVWDRSREYFRRLAIELGVRDKAAQLVRTPAGMLEALSLPPNTNRSLLRTIWAVYEHAAFRKPCV